MYHFVGIGGIGMSALARILLKRGQKVSGSDIKSTDLLQALQREGASVTIGHRAENIQKGMVVVYTSAAGFDNLELKRAKELNLSIIHRSDLLQELLSSKKELLIAGTHGKTTTSSLLSSVFLEAKKDPSFVLGGVLRGIETNARVGEGDYFIAETDESDGSFLKSSPYGAIVTNIDWDHLDFWKNKENLMAAFNTFCSKVSGPLVWCKESRPLVSLNLKDGSNKSLVRSYFPFWRKYNFSNSLTYKKLWEFCKIDFLSKIKIISNQAPIQPILKGFSYGFSDADIVVERFKISGFSTIFDLSFRGKLYRDISLNLIGAHNALNAAGVMGLSLILGVEEGHIRRAFLNFPGVERRLSKRGEIDNILFLDDYGHHPAEIRSTLKALREAAEGRRIVCLFQPHRYTRTKLLLEEFAVSFDDADLLFITDIYAASEKPLSVSSRDLVEKIEKRGKNCSYLSNISSIVDHLRPHDIFLSLGAGDVTDMGNEIRSSYKKMVSL